jgi:hypothetical protein
VADEDQDDEVAETGWRGTVSRMSGGFLPQAKKAPADTEPHGPMSDAQKRRAILGLDKRERQVGLIGSALAALIALTTTVPYVLKPKTAVNQTLPANKNHTCSVQHFTFDKATGKCNGKVVYSLDHWVFALVLLLVFALAIFVTVRIGRRGPLGFTTLMAGLAYETQVGVLGLPFIAAGGWLLIRAWRVQRYGSPMGTKTNPTGERRPPPARAERPTRAKKSKSKTPEPTGPAPNKRYTPKAQTKKKKAPVTPPSGS